MKKILLCCLMTALTLGSATQLFGLTDEIGIISFIDKQIDPKNPKSAAISVLRNATQLSDKDIDIGTALQNFDTIKTGAATSMEITIHAKTGIDAVLTVQPSTSLTLDITSLKSSQSGAINLLAGTLDLKVKKMIGSNQLSVKTSSANMGVRGTQFQVSYSVSGDILVSTVEGRVECQVEDGKVLFSAPGDVVQGSFDGQWNSAPVSVAKLADFRKKWFTQRIDAFRANPGKATRLFALMYLRFNTAFVAAYGELMANRDLIQQWIKEDNEGNTGSLAELNREKLKLFTSLAKLKRIQVRFERVYYRLLQLDELYAQGIAPTGQIKPNLSVAQFYKTFRDEKADMALKFADIQFITKLYAKRNDGSFPLEATTFDETGKTAPDFNSGKNDDGSDAFFN